MAKQVLVMGGSYFIGKTIVDVLLDNNYSVYTLNRGTRENNDERVINLKCDRNDSKQMNILLNKYSFDIVVDVSALNKQQVEILYNSLNKKNLSKFVLISSSAVYDIDNLCIPFGEDSPLKENKYWTSYGTNKTTAENFLIDKFKGTQTNLIILRPPYVYGENNYAQRESFIFEHICSDKPIIMPKDGSAQLQFIYVKDLANIILNLLNNNLEDISIFNIGNKESVTIREWIEYCSKAAGKNAKIIEFDYDKYNRNERDFFPFYNYDNVLDVSKLNKFYDKETNFLTGLENSFNWYRENRDSITFNENIIKNEEAILKELV